MADINLDSLKEGVEGLTEKAAKAIDEFDADAALASANARARAIFGGPIPAQYSVAADYAVRVFLLDLLYRRHGDDDTTAQRADHLIPA